MELHDMAQADTKFPCHMTQDNKEQQMCAGIIIYMNDIFKRSKDTDMKAMQDRLGDTEHESLGSLDGSKIVRFHKYD